MQFPLLSIIIFLPLVAGIAILLMPAHRRDMIRWTALIASVLTLMLTVAMYANYAVEVGDFQFVEGPIPVAATVRHLVLPGRSMASRPR
jgi:NADH-quinone oxidoreductase subunit M